MKKQGFTLAEVLITLGIIGVIASMTIPALMTNSQNQATATKLKKFYTTFNHALALYNNDNGSPGDLASTGLFTGVTQADTARIGTELVKYFKILQNCQMNADNICFAEKTTMLNSDSYNTLGGTDKYKFITTDGVAVSLKGISPGNCDSTFYGHVSFRTGILKSICGNAYVDINGPSAPNKYGRDTFIFVITGSGLIAPVGIHGLYDYNWDNIGGQYNCKIKAADNHGMGCAGRIMEEDWQINY